MKNPAVFVHLRELNNLLNESEVIRRRIVFIYALKDDIFIEKDRTKFFDLIIPVIPYINSTNSGDSLNKMLERAKEMGDTHDISPNYVLDVSPFIDDMRLLLNIYNEFLVYKRTLQTGQGLEGLHDEPMMSLIIFKNLYPKDFSDLQMEAGIVKRVFEAKAKFIGKKRDEIHEEIQVLTDKLENIPVDTLNSRNELISSFASSITNWQGIAYKLTTINPGGYSYYISEFLNTEYDFNTVKVTPSCSVSYRSWDNMDYYGYRNLSTYTCDNFEKLFSDLISRLDYIGIAEGNKIDATKQQIEKLKRESYQLSSLSLMELLNKYPTDKILGSDEIDNKLLLFMLRKGYINENYANYINYFKENSITKNDMKFILSIKNREALAFNYSLTKTEQIIKRLQLHEFEQKEILNINILNHLLEHKSDSVELQHLIGFLATGSADCWKFIDEYLDEIINRELFIQFLTSKWSAMWDHIYSNTQLTYERKIIYYDLILSYSEIESIVALNSKGTVNRTFEENEDILQKLNSIGIKRMIDVIETLDITFSRVNIDRVPSEILVYIFAHRHYTLNSFMINRITEFKKPSLCDQIDTQNYTTVNKLNYTPLIEYIHEYLEDYVQNIVLREFNTYEDNEAILDLLNRCIDNTELCVKIIQHEEFCLDNFQQCCYDLVDDKQTEVKILWDTLLLENKVKECWENIIFYWENFGLLPELITYIEQHSESLISCSTTCVHDKFIKELITENIDELVLIRLLPYIKMSVFSLSFEILTHNIVSALNLRCESGKK